MKTLTLVHVHDLMRMAHHDTDEDGIEWWWGPNGGLRMYFRDGIPCEPDSRWKRKDVVVHAMAGARAVIFPVLEQGGFGQVKYSAPVFGWHHLPGCDCEFCTE